MSGQNLSAITRFELYLLKNKQHNRFLGLFCVTCEFEERMTIAKDRESVLYSTSWSRAVRPAKQQEETL